MEQEQQRNPSVTVAQNFDDVFKSVNDLESVVPKVDEIVTEQQAPTPPTPETPKEEEVEKPVETSAYKKRLSNLIEDGIIENFAISLTDASGEKKDVFLSDLEEVDQDTYKTILASYKEAKDNEVKENYISKEGIDEITEKLINIKKAGGDITEIIQQNVSQIDNISKLKEDLPNDEQLQMNIVAKDLKDKGLSDRVIAAQIKDYQDNLQLDVEAEKILNFHLSAHQGEIEAKSQAEMARLEQEKEDKKKNKKELQSVYKDWGLPENIQKVLIENSTKEDQHGMTNTEHLFFSAIQDPKKLAKIAFLINNEEEYEKFFSNKKVLQANKEGLKPLFELNLKAKKDVRSTPNTTSERFDEVFNTQ